MQIAKTKEETSIRMLLWQNFDFGNRFRGAKFQLCVNGSLFISLYQSTVSFCPLTRDAKAQKAFPVLICVTMEFLAAFM